MVEHGQTSGSRRHHRLVRGLVVEPLDQVDLGAHPDHRTRRGVGHGPDDGVGGAHLVGHLDHVVGALGVDHHDAAGVLGPEGRRRGRA